MKIRHLRDMHLEYKKAAAIKLWQRGARFMWKPANNPAVRATFASGARPAFQARRPGPGP